MIVWLILALAVGVGAGRASKDSRETVIVEKVDGTVQVLQSRPSDAEYVVKRDLWGEVHDIQIKRINK